MRVLNILVIAAVFIFGVVQAEAGFLDDIIKKTTDKVQQAVEETVDEHVDKTLDIEKISPAEQSFPGTGEPAVGGVFLTCGRNCSRRNCYSRFFPKRERSVLTNSTGRRTGKP